jgi:hypothetical protein
MFSQIIESVCKLSNVLQQYFVSFLIAQTKRRKQVPRRLMANVKALEEMSFTCVFRAFGDVLAGFSMLLG